MVLWHGIWLLLPKIREMRFLVTVAIILSPLMNFAQTGVAEAAAVQQVAGGRSVTISGGLQVAVPTGEFAENYDGNLFGIYAELSMPLLNLPIEIGGGFVWHSLASQSQTVEIDNTLVPDNDRGDLFVRGNAYTYQVHGRIRPFNGRFRPYGELYTGVRNFSITSELKLDNLNQASGDLLERDFTFMGGYAIGAKFQLLPGFFLEARYDNQTGSKATYVDPDSIVILSDGSFTYDTQSSQTNQWAISLGVALSF